MYILCPTLYNAWHIKWIKVCLLLVTAIRDLLSFSELIHFDFSFLKKKSNIVTTAQYSKEILVERLFLLNLYLVKKTLLRVF